MLTVCFICSGDKKSDSGCRHSSTVGANIVVCRASAPLCAKCALNHRRALAQPRAMENMTIRLGVIGLSDGNGHPYSWSAIVNGYDPVAMQACEFPVIPEYLGHQ